MASEEAIRRAAIAVAMFDAGWPVPALALADHAGSDLGGPLDTALGNAILDLEALPAQEQPVEAAVGLRLLLVYVLAPSVLHGLPVNDLTDGMQEHAVYIASHVQGGAPAQTLKRATGVVCEWLEAPTVQRVIRSVADELEDCRVMSGEVLEERIRELLPSLGIHLDA